MDTKHTFNKNREFKVGDTVKFGAYGYLDMDECYKIIEVKSTLSMLGGVEYVIQASNGHTITAYADEIFPVR